MTSARTIGVIGDGDVLRAVHLPALAKLPRAKVRVIATGEREAGEALADRFQVPYWTGDPEKIIGDPSLDGVVLCVSPEHALPLIDSAFEQGKHVLWHTPLGLGLDDARAPLLACEPAHRVLTTWPYMLLPAVMASRQLLREGELGVPLRFRVAADVSHPDEPFADWASAVDGLYQTVPERNRRWAAALPAIAVLLLIGGRPESVSAPTDFAERSVAPLTIRFAAGGEGELSSEPGLRIETEGGTLVSRRLDRDLHIVRPMRHDERDGGREERVSLTKFPLISTHQRWVNSMLTGVMASELERETVLRTLAVLQAAHRSREAEGAFVAVGN